MEIYNLKFERDAQGRYFIGDHDDEKLNVIAELLLDNQARADARSLIESPHQPSLKGPRFHFFNQPNQTIMIKLFNDNESLTEETNPRIIDIDRLLLDSLINGWRNLMQEKPLLIMLSRRHDSDHISLLHQP